MMRNLLISLLVCVVGHPLLQAGERLTPERLWDLARLGSVCLHPDGNTVAYAVRRYNLPENQGTSEIHLLDLATQQDRLLIGSLKTADSLEFATTPQGLRLFYVAVPRGEQFQDAQPQVWSIDLQRGRAAASHFGRSGRRQSQGVADRHADCLHVRSETGCHRQRTVPGSAQGRRADH